MFIVIWEIFIAASSFLGASYVWLFAAPLPPTYDRFGITLSSLMFLLVGLFFSVRVCFAGKRFSLGLVVSVLATQALVVFHILHTPFFKI